MGSAEAVAAGDDDAFADLEIGGQHLTGDRRDLGRTGGAVGVDRVGGGDVGDRQPVVDRRTGHGDGVIEVDGDGSVGGVAGVGDRRHQIIDRRPGFEQVVHQRRSGVEAAVAEPSRRGQAARAAGGGA